MYPHILSSLSPHHFPVCMIHFQIKQCGNYYVCQNLRISTLLLCRPGLNGAIVPADSAQPHMKETINSIQSKLDHLYNRTQVNSIWFFLQSLHLEFKCKDRLFYFMWTFGCSGPRPDPAQHQQPLSERRGQWTGRSGQRRRTWGKTAELSEGGDTDGAGEKSVSVLLFLPGEAQYVKVRSVSHTHKH